MFGAQEDQLKIKRAELHQQQVRHKGRLQYFEEMGHFPSDSEVSSVRSSHASVEHKLPRAPASRQVTRHHPHSRTSKESRKRNLRYQQELPRGTRTRDVGRPGVEPFDWDHSYDYSHPTYIQTNVPRDTRVSDPSSLGHGYRERLPRTDMYRYGQQLHVDTDATSDQVSSQELSPPSTKYPPSEPGFKSPTRLAKKEAQWEPEKQENTPVTDNTTGTTAEKGVGGEASGVDGGEQGLQGSGVSDAGSIKGFVSLYPGQEKGSFGTVPGPTANMATSPAYTESSVQTDGGTVSVGTSPVHFSQMGTQAKERPASRESTGSQRPDDLNQAILSSRRPKPDKQKSTGSFLSSLVDIVDLVDQASISSEPPSLGSHSGRRSNRATPSYHGNKSSRPSSRQRPWTAPSSEKKGLMGYGRTGPSGREGVSGYDRTVPLSREGVPGYNRTVPLGREGVSGYDRGISPDLFADDEEEESITEQESRILEEVFFLK